MATLYFCECFRPLAPRRARTLWRDGADKGDLRSMFYLMMAHGEGKEIPEDMIRAYTNLALARPHVFGQQQELISIFEPQFKSQISAEDAKGAEIHAEEMRSRETFSPI